MIIQFFYINPNLRRVSSTFGVTAIRQKEGDHVSIEQKRHLYVEYRKLGLSHIESVRKVLADERLLRIQQTLDL